ncbi:MAG: serine/threonine-protein kinase [Propionibacteriaceae bacterium]
MRRAPSQPPGLPGYRALQHLGSGGFADVFLYEQDLPRRKVAVKVLIESAVNAQVRDRFVGEANAMAQLSAHPSIVTIYFAGIAPDGRPCLVMEYCPRPNLAIRYRREQIPVSEALRIGIRLSSAVETAHSAGILHRDIKPANVLVTEYGWPALTDFGISATIDTEDGVAEGMSVPWSAPELFNYQPHSDRRTDVYALGATIYALLAGRSPFEVRGGNNSAASLIARIDRDPVPAIGRDDVSPLLEQTLARAMHKRSEARFRSAYDLAEGLQAVEIALGFTPTQIDVMEALAGAEPEDSPVDDSTHLRGVVTIDQDAEFEPFHSTGSGSQSMPLRGLPEEEEEEPTPGLSRRATGVGLGILALVVVAIVVAVVVGPLLNRTEPPDPPPSVDVPADRPPAPTELSCEQQGGKTISCTWTNPDPKEGDVYTWGWVEKPDERDSAAEPTLVTEVPEDVSTPCIQVQIRRTNGTTGPESRACA